MIPFPESFYMAARAKRAAQARKRASRERLARLAILCITLALGVALFYEASNNG